MTLMHLLVLRYPFMLTKKSFYKKIMRRHLLMDISLTVAAFSLLAVAEG